MLAGSTVPEPRWRRAASQFAQAGSLAAVLIGGVLTAQAGERESRVPRAFAPATARPISDHSPVTVAPSLHESYSVVQPPAPAVHAKFKLPESGGAWRLRWREPAVEGEIRQVSAEFSEDDTAMVHSVGHVQMAQVTEPVRDPFNDRGGRSGAARVPSLAPAAPRESESPYRAPERMDEPVDDRVPIQPPFRPGLIRNPTVGTMAQPPVMDLPPADLPPDLPPTDPAPIPPFGELAPLDVIDQFDPFADPALRHSDCDRIYNQRNCCADEQRCKMAREFVNRHQITDIVLDITPRLRPDDPTLEEAAKREQISAAPSRLWRDRAGDVVADGRLVDYQWGHVFIEEQDGTIHRISPQTLGDDELCFLAAFWFLPTECMLADVPYSPRNWMPLTFTWKASALCHKPLLFEEVQLERYGHTAGPIAQPFVSGAHFFLNIAVAPYRSGINPPTECQYALGYYRPGSCAPWLLPPVPLSVRGGLTQAGAVLGAVYLLP